MELAVAFREVAVSRKMGSRTVVAMWVIGPVWIWMVIWTIGVVLGIVWMVIGVFRIIFAGMRMVLVVRDPDEDALAVRAPDLARVARSRRVEVDAGAVKERQARRANWTLVPDDPVAGIVGARGHAGRAIDHARALRGMIAWFAACPPALALVNLIPRAALPIGQADIAGRTGLLALSVMDVLPGTAYAAG
jgi:hypothetical protein